MPRPHHVHRSWIRIRLVWAHIMGFVKGIIRVSKVICFVLLSSASFTFYYPQIALFFLFSDILRLYFVVQRQQ